MQIIRNLSDLTTPLPRAVLTIGNFDGVHLGHREIFRKVVTKARELDGTATVFTFVPHPLKLLAPERAPRLINTYEEKERLIAASCIDALICPAFTPELARLPAEEFVSQLLCKRIGLAHLVVGYDYAFGQGRSGNVGLLQRLSGQHGFSLEVLEPIAQQGVIYSSTRIRELIQAGEVAAVVDLLGRHFTLEGTVVSGVGRGRQLGFPTANLTTDKELLPREGVYAAKIRRGEAVFDGVVNIGCNPTFGDRPLTVEVHLFDFRQQIYGEKLRLYFLERLRDERRFVDRAALQAAIAADVARARDLLRDRRIIEYREYLDCGLAGSAAAATQGEET